MGKKKSKTQKNKQRARRKQNKLETTQAIALEATKDKESLKKSSSPKKEPTISPKKNTLNGKEKEKLSVKQENVSLTPKKPPVKDKKDKIKAKKQVSAKKSKKVCTATTKEKLFLRDFLKKIGKKKYIVFNVALVLVYIVLFLSILLVGVFSWKSILFVLALLLFLLVIAFSYTKYMSGKIFSLVLILVMSFFTYKLQYTYDFIHALNKTKYEEKTYYVVTFDTSVNRNVYVLNNKKIGLLTTNMTNVERKLNTELDNVTYVSYEDMNDLVSSFYNQEFRAIIVNENQYKFLENSNYDREVKILYEFQAIGLKETS